MKHFIVAIRIPGQFGVREFVTQTKSIGTGLKKVGEYLAPNAKMIQVELKEISESYFKQMVKSGMRVL